MCSQHIDRMKVMPATAARVLALVDRHNLTTIRQRIIRKILNKKDDFLANPEFLKDMKSQPELLVLLLAKTGN